MHVLKLNRLFYHGVQMNEWIYIKDESTAEHNQVRQQEPYRIKSKNYTNFQIFLEYKVDKYKV